MNTKAFYVIAKIEEMTEESWKEIRKVGIGSSDAAAVLGYSTYRSPLAVYSSKTGKDEYVENKFTRWGKLLEPVIRENFVEDYNAVEATKITKIESFPFTVQSKIHNFMITSPDGFVTIDKDRIPLEIKTATVWQADKWAEDQVPDDYYCQVQHLMAVLDSFACLVVALVGKDLIWRHVPRNNRFIKDMIKHEKLFWEHVQKRIPPLPIGSDDEKDYLNRLYSDEVEKVVDLPGLETIAKEYLTAGYELEELKKKRAKLSGTIMFHMGNNKRADMGKYKATWSRFDRSGLDQETLKIDHPDLYQKYTKKSPSSRSMVRKPK